MPSTTFITALVALAATASAHMEMSFPPPLNSKYNPLATKIDYSMTSPLLASGANYPCKGYQTQLGSPSGASVVTWTAGSEANMTIQGGAFHDGGSCQAALSYDNGKSWKVIHSYQGACPTSSGGTFKFGIPSDAKDGGALFAWLWWNHTGFREMYMNCASVTIAAGNGPAPAVPFSQRPDIFKANIGNGCTTADAVDVFFPNPGPDVTTVGTKMEGTYFGNCGPASDSSSSGSPPAPVSSASTASTAPPAKSPAPDAVANGQAASPTSILTIVIVTPTNSPSSPITITPVSGLKVSTNGECSGTTTCKGSTFGGCCSKWGYCGSTIEHCGADCQSAFGDCGANVQVRGRQWK